MRFLRRSSRRRVRVSESLPRVCAMRLKRDSVRKPFQGVTAPRGSGAACYIIVSCRFQSRAETGFSAFWKKTPSGVVRPEVFRLPGRN